MQSFKGNKSYLPTKKCLTCERNFVYRKKWAKNWDQIKYCSEKCQKNRQSQNKQFSK
jgi:hypothetical protein